MRRIVLVKSCQKFKDRQDACRATWAGELSRQGIPIFFAEGGHEKTEVRDCWLLLNCDDEYMDNSFKVRDALALLLKHDPFDFVFIADDDTYVHPMRWLAFVPVQPFVGLASPPRIWWVHGGGGWYLNREACALFVAGISRRCSWDDQLCSEILRRHGIEIDNHPDLFAQWDERVSPDNDLITCHGVKPDEMHTLYRSTYDVTPVHDHLSRA